MVVLVSRSFGRTSCLRRRMAQLRPRKSNLLENFSINCRTSSVGKFYLSLFVFCFLFFYCTLNFIAVWCHPEAMNLVPPPNKIIEYILTMQLPEEGTRKIRTNESSSVCVCYCSSSALARCPEVCPLVLAMRWCSRSAGHHVPGRLFPHTQLHKLRDIFRDSPDIRAIHTGKFIPHPSSNPPPQVQLEHKGSFIWVRWQRRDVDFPPTSPGTFAYLSLHGKHNLKKGRNAVAPDEEE